MSRRGWHSCQPMDLHSLARAWFVDHRRIELQKLAAELGISRATAYRWAGSTDQLIAEVLGSLVEDTFTQLAQRSQYQGSERVLEVLTTGMRYAYHFKPLRQFLNHNPQLGLKIVTASDGAVQMRTIECLTALLQEEMDAGHMRLAVKPAVMAFALTRMIESFLYADLITGSPADLDSAREILRLLLRPDPDSDPIPNPKQESRHAE